ncbi:hypothetical protein DRJ00_08430 [Candidatus Aerophobetes bacterium]|uniref:Glycoside hydrolase family 29 N-terminal domain-containing protein n=1 Tax=Aerophobetes bacterium TaxID=2030807 RepID=A0A497E3H4_UNCAE|nr:MAG: hypothetical protein DRJ00_08430 [Candidatus Aerophobetes bacterium]
MKEKQEKRVDSQERMKWWNEARFGMFIHWGLYSVFRKRLLGNAS